MKKILLIVFIAACFGCSKKSTPNPTPQNWIMGKWKRQYYGDTAYYNTGAKIYTVGNLSNELNFTDTSHVTSSAAGPNAEIGTYSLSTMILNPHQVNGAIYKITKLSDTKIKLDWHYATTGATIVAYDWVDVYDKE